MEFSCYSYIATCSYYSRKLLTFTIFNKVKKWYIVYIYQKLFSFGVKDRQGWLSRFFVQDRVAEERCVLWPIINTLSGIDTRRQ